MTTLIYRIFTVAAVTLLLSACAPPTTVPASSNLTLEMRRVHASLNSQEQVIKELSRKVAELEDQLQLQNNELERLGRTPQTVSGDYQPGRAPQPTGEASTQLQGEGSPTEVYLQAFGDYASGHYQTAIHGFATFLQRYPNNSYASNAQFWLGDCYFNQQQYPLAIQEFERVLSEYQSAPKNPDALLKIAIAQLQLGATDEARQAIETLGQRYPKSTATQKAQKLTIP
ncbi:MAG: tol-pal system protein YbgF [Deltaproteobacteria bacterium]|nr:MAG: tol-pal system protein YbgF [Deltaproteobacteria bacterium]